jgi:peptide/nickel transport system permease protein
MLKYLAKRVLQLVFVLFGALVIAFVLMHVVPADPARAVAGMRATRAQVEAIAEKMGLNDPLYVQFGRYLSRLAKGDLGISPVTYRPVAQDLAMYLPATLELVLVASLIVLIGGVGLGVFAAVYSHRKLLTLVVKTVGTVGMGVPVFWLGLVLQTIFYGKLALLPATGRIASGIALPATHTGLLLVDSLLAGNLAAFRSGLVHIVLPAVTLGFNRAGIVLRYVHAEMSETLAKDYVRTARAKGLPTRSVIWHALRNALVPVVTMFGLEFGWMLGGALLVEVVFAWPGLGRYAFESINAFDFSAVMAVVLLFTLIFGVINLLTDLLYGLLDPRVVYD